MIAYLLYSNRAEQGGQLDPQSLAVQSVGVLIGSLLLLAGKLPLTFGWSPGVNDPVLASIARMRQRPAMYIGENSADAMFRYLAGYSGALDDHTKIDLASYVAFIESLYEKYGRVGGHSWSYVLREKTGSDGAALDLFFDELDAFLKRNA